MVVLPLLEDLHRQGLGERIDDGDPDTVQATRHLVGVVVELPASVELRQHHLDRGHTLSGVHVRRDATTIVLDGDRPIDVHVDPHLGAVTSQGLVDGVVDNLVHHVVQTTGLGVADVHTRALANCLKALEDLDVRAGLLHDDPDR